MIWIHTGSRKKFILTSRTNLHFSFIKLFFFSLKDSWPKIMIGFRLAICKRERGMGNGKWEREREMGMKISSWLENSFYSLKIVCYTRVGQFSSKKPLHSSIFPFTESFTQSVRRRTCLNLEILNTFFVKYFPLILNIII